MPTKRIRKPNETMNAVVYCRVSSKQQVDNLSLGTQETRGVEYGTKRGWKVARVFRDEGASAKTTDRIEFQNMLAFCKNKNHAIGFVIVHDSSRFARNADDYFRVVAELRKWGIRLCSVMEEMDDSPTGRLISGIKAVFNEHDNNMKAERTKVGMQRSASMGRFPFKAALGYQNVGTGIGPNLIPDPKRAPLIVKAFELFATGTYSKVEVLKR